MGRLLWSLLFALMTVLAVGMFVVAPYVGWWLPEGVSTHAGDVDDLFYIILYVTGFFFILTEGLLVYFMFAFGARKGSTGAAGAAHGSKLAAPFKKYIPDEQRLELAWTIIPAAILLYIAFAQVSTWAQIKYESRMPQIDAANLPLPIGVSARQFEWRMRYPNPERWLKWKKWQQDVDAYAVEDPATAAELLTALRKDVAAFSREDDLSDVHVPNELHIWTDVAKAGSDNPEDFPAFVAFLSTIDVQHNFNIPNFRVKQDALPGKIIPVWFRPTKTNFEAERKKKQVPVKDKQGNQRKDEGGDPLFKYVRDYDAPDVYFRDPEGNYGFERGYVYEKDKEGNYAHVEGSKQEFVYEPWDIACAELCGRWHYHMIAKVYVHPSREHFERWLLTAAAKGSAPNPLDPGLTKQYEAAWQQEQGK